MEQNNIQPTQPTKKTWPHIVSGILDGIAIVMLLLYATPFGWGIFWGRSKLFGYIYLAVIVIFLFIANRISASANRNIVSQKKINIPFILLIIILLAIVGLMAWMLFGGQKPF